MEYKFNLQLFAEDDGTTAEDSIETVDNEPELGELTRVVLDEKGNVRLLKPEPETKEPAKEPEKEPETKEPETKEPEKQEPESKADDKSNPDKDVETPATEQVYSPDEIRTMDIDKIDPKRLPPEMQAWYRAMQAPITRKNQELADQRRQADELIQKLAKAAESAQKPQQPQMTKAEFYSKLDVKLRSDVAKDFGVALDTVPENITEWPPAMRLAYDDAANNFRAEAQNIITNQQRKQSQQDQFIANANKIEAELKGLDADALAEITERLRAKELPVKDVESLKDAMIRGDVEAAKRLFEPYRTQYRAKINGIKPGEKKPAPTPPKTEASGKPPAAEPNKLPNYTELGSLKSFDDRLAWLTKNGITP